MPQSYNIDKQNKLFPNEDDGYKQIATNGNGQVAETDKKLGFPNDVTDELWEKENLRYGWGIFKPR